MESTKLQSRDVFAQADAFFGCIQAWLRSEEAGAVSHDELEQRLTVDGRELMRELLQGHLRLRAMGEQRLAEVIDADGSRHTHVGPSGCGLMTVFGTVRIPRLAYGGREVSDLHPADAVLNLPKEKHSHGVRREVAEETAKVSYDNVEEAVGKHTGAKIAKRQIEELVLKAAQDFDGFYLSRLVQRVEATSRDLLVLTSDGKGIVMLRRYLREATQRAADESEQKLGRRLSKGEKRNRKRMATVAAVYSVAPFPRTAEEVMLDLGPLHVQGKRPKAHGKRVWASVEKDPETVIREVFDEAERRDPERRRRWVYLVDGANGQLSTVMAEARRRKVDVTVTVDFIHVLEYLWSAAWSFFSEGDRAAEKWVTERAIAILDGRSSDVAAGIRRSATRRGLSKNRRKGADHCAGYLTAKRPRLTYKDNLAHGLPISTGVIEGACRHLIGDRLDITGARWSIAGAEAVLRLRALRSSGDLDDYWRYHFDRELERNHLSRYQGRQLPEAA